MKTFIVLLLLSLPLLWMSQLEPRRMGPVHNLVRNKTVLKNTVAPSVKVLSPVDNGPWEGHYEILLANWEYRPELAMNASTEFCGGFVEDGRGHSHVWTFNVDTGAQVKFYGAGGWTDLGGGHLVRSDAFPPGNYKAYIQLQNHDHSPAIPNVAPAFPGMTSVNFTVE